MKLLMVIVNEEYQKRVSMIFQEYECSATMIASTGDFLAYGDTIFMVGVEEEKAELLLHVIEQEFQEKQKSENPIFSTKDYENGNRIKVFCLSISHFARANGPVTEIK